MELANVISREELDEVFPRPPLREVVFEVRFTTRLRIQAEIWRFQDEIVKQYPEAEKESGLQPSGTLIDVSTFHDRRSGRVVKVSHQNLLIGFSRYACFEEFRAEVEQQTARFCRLFAIDVFNRVGLRYVNQIGLPDSAVSSLLRYVRPVLAFDRFPIDYVQQFATELHSRYKEHFVTLRSALLPGALPGYVFDIDCHWNGSVESSSFVGLLDTFHDSAQTLFLSHVTEEFKNVMRAST